MFKQLKSYILKNGVEKGFGGNKYFFATIDKDDRIISSYYKKIYDPTEAEEYIENPKASKKVNLYYDPEYDDIQIECLAYGFPAEGTEYSGDGEIVVKFTGYLGNDNSLEIGDTDIDYR